MRAGLAARKLTNKNKPPRQPGPKAGVKAWAKFHRLSQTQAQVSKNPQQYIHPRRFRNDQP